MNEVKAIKQDLRNGALPRSEWLGFAAWLIRKMFWGFAALAVLGTLICLMVK